MHEADGTHLICSARVRAIGSEWMITTFIKIEYLLGVLETRLDLECSSLQCSIDMRPRRIIPHNNKDRIEK